MAYARTPIEEVADGNLVALGMCHPIGIADRSGKVDAENNLHPIIQHRYVDSLEGSLTGAMGGKKELDAPHVPTS